MLNIVTCLTRDDSEVIENILREYLDSNSEMTVMLEHFTSTSRMLKKLEDIHDGENYLIILGDFIDSNYTLNLLSTVRNKLKHCYILFLSQNARLLRQVVNQNTRISGFITLPLLDSTFLYLVKQVYESYMEENSEDNDKTLIVYTVLGDDEGRERIMVRIPFKEIYFIEADHRKTRYVMQSKTYSDNVTLTERALKLDKRFVRCHHAFIINVEKINSINYGKNVMELKSGDVIPISRGKKDNLKQVLEELHMTISNDFSEKYIKQREG